MVNSLLCLCLLAPVNVQQHANGGCLLHAWCLPGNRMSYVWFLHKCVCLIKLMWARLPYFNLPVWLRSVAMWYFVDTGRQHGCAQTIKVHLPLSGLVFHMWASSFVFYHLGSAVFLPGSWQRNPWMGMRKKGVLCQQEAFWYFIFFSCVTWLCLPLLTHALFFF